MMHDNEADIDTALVHQLVRSQFPQWSDLPLERIASGGTMNAIYGLGDELSVRLPRTSGGAEDLEREVRWLPHLAPALPATIPTIVATGEPAQGYPWAWAVMRWIEGETPVEGRLDNPEQVARNLAEFVTAMRESKLDGGPTAHRGGPLSTVDQEFRAGIDLLRDTDERINIGAAVAVWEEALAAPSWSGDLCWVHSDLMPSNLLIRDGTLTAVLDFGTAGVGDPACDLIPAWNLLPPSARPVFRDAVDIDEASWLRARGWALAMAIIQLPYYRNTNPTITANARYVLAQILDGC